MKNSYKISIITPVLNRVNFLGKNIQSIKNQDYLNIEHLIIDGGSTDGTLDVIRKYDGSYDMKWVSEKDGGLYNALNKGFKMASGDIICWLDSDDSYIPGTLEKVVKIFKDKPEVDVVFGDILISDENGKIINYIKHTDFDLDVLIYFGMNLNPQSIFWKKEIHRELGYLNEEYKIGADYDFFIRMGLTGAKFYHIKDFLSIYAVHSNQITSKLNKLGLEEGRLISKKYINKNLNSNQIKKIKIITIIKRIREYIKQGDILYIFRRLLGRIGILNLKP